MCHNCSNANATETNHISCNELKVEAMRAFSAWMRAENEAHKHHLKYVELMQTLQERKKGNDKGSHDHIRA